MRSISLISAITLIIIMSSCTEEIKVNLGSITPELVVDGAITTDTMVHTIYLTKTANYFSNVAPQGISGALVTINDGVRTITLTEDPVVQGAYHTPSTYFGVPGRTYTLTIDSVDVNGDGIKERYTASCILNAVPPIKSIAVEKEQLFSNNVWAVEIWMHDPGNVSNYYLMRLYRNNVCVTDTINQWGVISDAYFNGQNLNGQTVMYFSSKHAGETLENGDLVTLQLCGITKDYITFINEVDAAYKGSNPLFGGQSSNISTNIVQQFPANASGSPQGFFAAYATTYGSTVYKSN